MFFGFLGVYEQRHQKNKQNNKKKQTHDPELADADDGLCFFVFLVFLGVYEQKHQKTQKNKKSKKKQTHGPELHHLHLLVQGHGSVIFVFLVFLVFMSKGIKKPKKTKKRKQKKTVPWP